MGKSRRRSGGNSPVTNFIDSNNKLYKKIIDNTEFTKKVVEKRLEKVLEYCNENNLEIIDVKDIPHSANLNSLFSPALLGFKDKNTGKIITIYENALYGKHSLNERNIKQVLDQTRSELNNIYSKVSGKYIENIQSINITNGSALGSFAPYAPNGINIMPQAFNDKKQWATGLTGTMIHEMGHCYDYNVIGDGLTTGLDSVFTRYPWGGGPTKYASGNKKESISTVCEQVYTERVREDAKLSDGSPIDFAFSEKYGTPPDFHSSSDQKKMYKMWSNDPKWKPMVKEAKKIMGI